MATRDVGSGRGQGSGGAGGTSGSTDEVRPRELIVAARVADALVYAAGVAGVVAGGVLFQQGEHAFAVVAWVLTFVAGVGLRIASWASKALAELLKRTARMDDDLARISAELREQRSSADQRSEGPPGLGGEPRRRESPPDPWKRLGGWH